MIVGIDPSLTATAVCRIDGSDFVTINVYKTKSELGTTTEKLSRMLRQVKAAADSCDEADLILIEGPSFSSKGAATRDLAGLWWLMYRELALLDRPIGVVTPSVLKKWVTGSGAADKFRVGQHIAKRWPDVELRSNDQADALGIASIGLHQAGLLPWTPTAFQVETLTKVDWNQAPAEVAA